MEQQNVREYELIREEMLKVKECTTQYMSFVIGGSGVAAVAIALFSGRDADPLAIGYVAMILSLLASLVFLILFYKFRSHNRFAAYCMLLGEEQFPLRQRRIPDSIIAWETCINELRELGEAREKWEEYLGQQTRLLIRDVRLYLDHYTKSLRENQRRHVYEQLFVKKLLRLLRPRRKANRHLDHCAMLSGLRYFSGAIVGRSKTSSWRFPPLIMAVFLTITLGLLAASWQQFRVYTWDLSQSNNVLKQGQLELHQGSSAVHDTLFSNVQQGIVIDAGPRASETAWSKLLKWLTVPIHLPTFHMIVVLLGLTIHLLLWSRFFVELHKVMNGSATIYAFYDLWFPIRLRFLNKRLIFPTYGRTP